MSEAVSAVVFLAIVICLFLIFFGVAAMYREKENGHH